MKKSLDLCRAVCFLKFECKVVYFNHMVFEFKKYLHLFDLIISSYHTNFLCLLIEVSSKLDERHYAKYSKYFNAMLFVQHHQSTYTN